MDGLPPCPWCGAVPLGFGYTEYPPRKRQRFRVYCGNAGVCVVEPYVDGDTEADAVRFWSKRESTS